MTGVSVMLVAVVLLFHCCATDRYPVNPESGFPVDVGEIIEAKCATAGCHNAISYHACAGLDFSSWESLFQGGNNNSSVIPYRPDQSYFFFAVNTFPDLGPSLQPVMPLNHDPLTREEVLIIRNWIAAGAPAKDGHIKFSDNAERSKVYVINQGCDLVTVFDAESQLVMRCVDIGGRPSIEAPHDIHVSPDGQYWYVTFFAGTLLQKYSTIDDRLVAELDLGISGWHTMNISEDSRFAALSHWNAQGRVAYVDLETMSLVAMWQGLSYPHGCAFSENGNSLYVVSQMGNFFYKLDITDPQNPDLEMIPVQTGELPVTFGSYMPYVIQFTPDYQKYYITCQGTDEVRGFRASNDSLESVAQASGVPQLCGFSESTPYMFVTCMVDTTDPNTHSSVDVFNWHNGSYVTTVYPGFQERGLAVDDEHDVVYVANRNVDPGGPAPHHTTSCGGRNGSVSLIRISTLEVIPQRKTEVAVDPYGAAIRR